MKWLTCSAVMAAVVLLSGASAVAGLTAVANWDGGPAVNPSWEAGTDPAFSGFPPGPGLDWRIGSGEATQAVSGVPQEWAGQSYPNSDGVGKWGGALWDDVNDGLMYITIQDGEIDELQDAQGTIEFWFKPEWDPALDTTSHALFLANRNRRLPRGDGVWLQYNGDGTVSNIWQTWGDWIDVGHDWTSNPLVQQDWNHIAVTWDSVGNYSYCNGVKVGETIYSGPSPRKVDWEDTWMGLFFGRDHASLDDAGINESDGLWDSFAIWDEVRYSGATYDVPTEPIVRVGLAGDRNGDGWVGQADLDIVLTLWGRSGVEIDDLRADVNGDEFVGQTDLDYVLGDWGQGTPPPPVPEPATLGMLALCGLALLRRRPKSRSRRD